MLIVCSCNQKFSNVRSNSQPPNEPGNCYAECQVNDISSHEEEYYVYTGQGDEELVDIETKEIQISPKHYTWINKKDKNCLSKNPEDCMILCLMEVPADTLRLLVLKDTTQTKNFIIEKLTIYDNISNTQKTEWRKVVCESDINRILIGKIQNALREKGFYKVVNTYILDEYTKSKLKEFQMDNYLPTGNFNLETMRELGVD